MKKKLRIGILCPNLLILKDYELRIFDEIFQSDWAEIVLLITDGRPQRSAKNRLSSLLKSKIIFGKIIFKLMTRIERLFFSPPDLPNKTDILEKLRTIESVSLSPARKGFVDIFDSSDTDSIQKYELDLILRHEFNIIKGTMLNIAKHGIWSFHHADNNINRGVPAGFWEVAMNEPITGVTLQKLNDELDGGEVIDKGFYSTQLSYVQNEYFICEKSVLLLMKNLHLLATHGSIKTAKSPTYSNSLYKSPNLTWVLIYQYNVLKRYMGKAINLGSSLLGYRRGMWALFSGKGKITSGVLWRSKFHAPDRGEFWADPFVTQKENKDYIFFENYSYKTDIAKISCGRLEDGKIKDIQNALVCDYHLSYPHLVEVDGQHYMLPETCGSNRLEVWKATNFPTEWILHATAFEGESVADPTIYIDKDNVMWLFLNKSSGPIQDHCSELYIYQISDLSLKHIKPHALNPVLIDSRIARNAGNIFHEDGNVIRPSQRNVHSQYGFGLNLSKIKTLTIDTYEEDLITIVTPKFKKGLVGTHHVTQYDGGYFIDACYKRYQG